MKILGVDTTTRFLCLGLYDGERVYEYNLDAGAKHSALLVPTIKRMLDVLGLGIGDIDYFACGIGPGSFTGIRVGIASIQGFAWPGNKPVVGIPTLDIIAENAQPCAGYVAPVIDARRNLLYCSMYLVKNQRLKKTAPYMLLSIDELLPKLKRRKITLTGDGAGLYREKIRMQLPQADILDTDYWYPKAGHIIALALQRIKLKKFTAAEKIKPIYLYPKDCQIRRSA